MNEFTNYFLIFGISNFILHFIMYLYNRSENYNNINLAKTIITFIMISVSIIGFTFFYIIDTGITKLDSILLFYIIISIISFIIHYILDLDILFQFSKEFNFTISAFFHIFLLAEWFFGIVM